MKSFDLSLSRCEKNPWKTQVFFAPPPFFFLFSDSLIPPYFLTPPLFFGSLPYFSDAISLCPRSLPISPSLSFSALIPPLFPCVSSPPLRRLPIHGQFQGSRKTISLLLSRSRPTTSSVAPFLLLVLQISSLNGQSHAFCIHCKSKFSP